MSRGEDVRILTDYKVIGTTLKAGTKGYFVESKKVRNKVVAIIEIHGIWYEVPGNVIERR